MEHKLQIMRINITKLYLYILKDEENNTQQQLVSLCTCSIVATKHVSIFSLHIFYTRSRIVINIFF